MRRLGICSAIGSTHLLLPPLVQIWFRYGSDVVQISARTCCCCCCRGGGGARSCACCGGGTDLALAGVHSSDTADIFNGLPAVYNAVRFAADGAGRGARAGAAAASAVCCAA